MTDELNIRENQARKDALGIKLDNLPGDDEVGEHSWALANGAETGPSSPPPPAQAASSTESRPLLDTIPEEPEEEEKDEDASPFAGFPGFGGDEEETPKGPGLDIQRFIRGILSRRGLIATVASLITGLFTLLAVTFLHPSWIATVTLIKRSSTDLFVVGTSGSPFKPQTYRLETLMDTLLLPSTLEETLRRSGVGQEMEARKFVKAIEVKQGKNSNILNINIQWDEREKAAELANNLAEIFIDKNRAIRRSDAEEALLYYQEQLRQAEKEAADLDAELQAFQEEYKISDITTQIQVLVTDISSLKMQYETSKAQVKALTKDLDRLNRAIEKEPEMIVQSSYYQNPLKKNLTELEWALEQARGRYTDDNPKVIDLISRINQIKSLIERGKDEDNQSNTFAHNPVREELMTKRYETEGLLNQERIRAASLEKTLRELEERLELLSAKQKDYEQLKAKKDAAALLRSKLANRVEEARVMMERNEADFEILERAVPPDEPESSGRRIMVIAGAVLGTGAGLFLALLLELLDKRVRTRRDALDLGGTELVLEFQHVPDYEQVVIDTQYPTEPVVTIFRRFVNKLDAALKPEQWQSLAIISLERRVGRSLIATDMAQTLALKEREVILVDADLTPLAGERPETLYELEKPEMGLLQVLESGADPMQALQQTVTPGVRLLSASSEAEIPDTAVLQLGSRRMSALVRYLRGFKGHVLYDLSPLQDIETIYECAVAIGNAMLVVRSGQSIRPDVKEMVERLQEQGVEIQAAVITDVPYELMQEKPVYEPAPVKKKNWLPWKKRKKAPKGKDNKQTVEATT
jgi:uncharacterized protein involved in exopolysaccharide biosynthesis